MAAPTISLFLEDIQRERFFIWFYVTYSEINWTKTSNLMHIIIQTKLVILFF